ncbi:seipin-2-like [Tripterygium wilfordii]|uniref:seipin-2-like n=1 Tax=Tripterygium wilfordii TaxID=458696 RepID=UPI0018F84D92|nr:seipin-2-like [Tripterygium wilfordii]
MDESKTWKGDGDENFLRSQSLSVVLKLYLLKFVVYGAEKVLKDGKSVRLNSLAFDRPRSFSSKDLASSSKERRCRAVVNNALQENERNDEEYVNVSRLVNHPSLGGYSGGGLLPLNFFAYLAILPIKFMGFQINVLVSLLTFPIRLSYLSLMFFIFPIRSLKELRRCLIKRVFQMWDVRSKSVKQKAQKSMLNVAMRLGCGFFWSSYVFFLLLGLLVSGFVLGSLIVRQIAVQPIQITESLNFDYTKPSPVALVPIMSSPGMTDTMKQRGARAIPYNHKLRLTVSLTLPESEYNRKLGVFVVRVDFLSANGEVTASSSHPSMLRFKSEQLRHVEAIIRSAAIIPGLQSESQILNIKMKEFTEGLEPTAYLKVVLEQRAEFEYGAGIPEIYGATLVLESGLPLLKKSIWYWRRTILVWTSLTLFMLELMFILVFCKPLLKPRGRPGVVSSNRVSDLNNIVSWRKTGRD